MTPTNPETSQAALPTTLVDFGCLSEQFDAFLFDAFGVLNLGNIAILGASERVNTLRRAGKSVRVVSNSASEPKSALAEKLRSMGFSWLPEEIITSRDVLIENLGHSPRSGCWGVMAADNADLSDLPLTTQLLKDEIAHYHSVDGFIFLGSATWNDGRQAMLTKALLTHPRPVLVANPDRLAPREYGFSREPGHYADELVKAGIRDIHFFGKPYPGIFRLALASLPNNIPASRVVMVGDTLHTDILGAQGAGLCSVLVTSHGLSQGNAIGRDPLAPLTLPNWIVENI